MKIEATGRGEIAILLSINQARHVERYGFDALNRYSRPEELSRAIRREDEMQQDMEEQAKALASRGRGLGLAERRSLSLRKLRQIALPGSDVAGIAASLGDLERHANAGNEADVRRSLDAVLAQLDAVLGPEEA